MMRDHFRQSIWGRNKAVFGANAAILAVVSAGLLVSACSGSKVSDPFAGKGSPKYTKSGPLPKGGGRYHIGKPYQVAGRTYYPKAEPGYDRTGIASWYGPRFHRRMTANGEWYDMEYRSAAHATLPIPSYAKVTNLENGRELIVRINDRGPFSSKRIIDLSKRSAEILGTKTKGLARVRVQYLGRAPLNDQGSHLASMNTQLQRGATTRQMIAYLNQGKEHRRSPAQSVVTARNEWGGQGDALSAPEGYFIQVAAYSDVNNVRIAKERLSGVGPVVVTPASSAAYGTVYRVKIGPLPTQQDADVALRDVVSAGHSDARVVYAAK